jgi:hypothetical protein
MLSGGLVAYPLGVSASARGSTRHLLIPPHVRGGSGGVRSEEGRQVLLRLAREMRLSGRPRETVERLFHLDALCGNYLYLSQERMLVLTGAG